MRGIDQSVFAEIAPVIRDFWDDESIKQTFEQRNLFQIVSLLVEFRFVNEQYFYFSTCFK